MKQTLPDEVYNDILNRLNEVTDDLIDTSQMIERGEDEFNKWCQILVFDCVQFHFNKEAIKEPRHPKGLIAGLKKQRKKLNEICVSLASLPDPYVRSTWSNNFNFESLAEFEDFIAPDFMEPLSEVVLLFRPLSSLVKTDQGFI